MRRVQNRIRNSGAAGAIPGVVGSGGAVPTNWITGSGGLALEVLAVSEHMVRLRASGTVSGAHLGFYPDGNTRGSAPLAAFGQRWTFSWTVHVVGTPVGVANYSLVLVEHSESATLNVAQQSQAPVPTVPTRLSYTRSLTEAGTTRIIPWLWFGVTDGSTVDVTFELSAPQLENLTGQALTTPSEYVSNKTGLVVHPERLSASPWGLVRAAVYPVLDGSVRPPMGRADVWWCVDSSTSGTHDLFTGSLPLGRLLARAMVKAAEWSNAAIIFHNATESNNLLRTNLVPGNTVAPVVSGARVLATRVTELADGWFELVLLTNMVASGTNFYLRLYDDALNFSWIGNGAKGVHVSSLEVMPWFADTIPADLPYVRNWHGAGVDGVKYFSTDQSGAPLPGPFGLLMEPSATNLVFPSSMEMGTGKWSPSDGSACTATLNAALAPDGTLTATKQIPTVTSNTKYLFRTFTGAVNTQYCASVYVKAAGLSLIPRARIGLGNTAFQNLDRHVNIDLTTGALTPAPTNPPELWGMEVLPDGWFRVWAVVTSDADGGNYVVGVHCVNSAGSSIFAGDGTSGILVWGAMVEANRTSPTSVIHPTTTAAVVRAVDQVVSDRLPTTTNLLRYSEEFSNAVWTKGSSSTITPNVINGPTGALTADLFAGTGGGVGYCSQLINAFAGKKLTYSIYAKKAATSVVRTLYTGTHFNGGGVNYSVDWDLDTGVATLSAAAITAGATAYMEDAGGGWWRLVSTATATTTGSVECQLLRFYGVSDSVYIWGAQAEQQDTVNPYVLTVAAAAAGPRQANTAKFTYTDGTTEVANWNGTRTESAPKVLQSIKVRKA
jgi:hypothetical protein